MTATDVRRVIDAIHRDPGADLSFHTMARLAHCSPTTFARAFFAPPGTTLTRYRIGARIEHAKRLLTTTDHPVTRIVHDVGYTGEGYFRRLFTATVGVSPTRYRQSGRPAARRTWTVINHAGTRIDGYNGHPDDPASTLMAWAELTPEGHWHVTAGGVARDRTYTRESAPKALRTYIDHRLKTPRPTAPEGPTTP